MSSNEEEKDPENASILRNHSSSTEYQRLESGEASLNLEGESYERRLKEKEFLLACERGDIGSARKLLAERDKNHFNVNCLDPLGRNALLIAIENENIEMIELLLKYEIETGDAILYAIVEENVEAVEIIVDHLETLDKFNPETQGVEINEHSAFTPDITPLILAAHKDNYEIIKLFLDKRCAVKHPHDVRCCCDECEAAREEDSLRLSRSRINAYRALASPSLICLSAKDPILYSFELSWELRRLSYIENEFRAEYQELAQKCQKFSVNMLDQVRGSKELQIVLNHTTSAWEEVKARRAATTERLARLKLAINLRQKAFVAHPNCQQLLSGIWYEGLPGLRNRSIVLKVLMIILIGLSFPILSIIYLLAPKSRFASFIRQPFIKFVCHSASYIFFLFLIILASQRIDSIDNVFGSGSGHELNRKDRRGPAPTPVEIAILIWLFGLIWVEIKQLWGSGIHDYCHNLWNILDFITNSLYLCTAALRAVAYYQVESETKDLRYQHAERHLGRNLSRKDWNAWDPTLVSECVFATANIFSSLKLVHIFTVNPHLGPLKISLGRMVIDILKFFLVYALVLFAFACGLNQLLWYYATMRKQECDEYLGWAARAGPDEQMTPLYESYKDSCDNKYKSCSSIYHTAETLFWALFGLIDLSHFTLKEQHILTEWTGRTIFGSYSCCSIIVLLNMLIAMMSNSYQYISDQSDVEWKFARSKLFVEYFEDTATLPPPFNMIPSPKTFYYVLRWLFDRYCGCSAIIQAGKQRSMRFVTRNLVKRYIAQMQRVKQKSEGVTEDDDISAFRYELLGILRDAGFATGHRNINQKTYSRNKKRSAMAERRLNMKMNDFDLPCPPSFQQLQHTAARRLSSASKGSIDTLAQTPKKEQPLSRAVMMLNWKRLKKRVSFKSPSPRESLSGLSGISGRTQKSSSKSFDEPILENNCHLPGCNNGAKVATKSISLNRPTLQKQRRKSEDTMLDIDADETTDLVL
ncbi:hypothetical protein WR25_23941 [Diploscapter pachys]|uniref:Transient receptor ion channel domain-containing protein n=1 Tax=Diploscapter pachys TaxID=2018661 RepID=A0A2A2J9Q3_9BILA|nr:hypothetical protein WR25_23941 [Diploscapter pachys]